MTGTLLTGDRAYSLNSTGDMAYSLNSTCDIGYFLTVTSDMRPPPLGPFSGVVSSKIVCVNARSNVSLPDADVRFHDTTFCPVLIGI